MRYRAGRLGLLALPFGLDNGHGYCPCPMSTGPASSGSRPRSRRPSKAAIQRAAAEFAEQWQHAESEQAEQQSFWNALFRLFGVERWHVGIYEQQAERRSTGRKGRIDLLVPGQMAVEHKSRGADLDQAMSQLEDYLHGLKPVDQPWLLLACDFARFRWRNLVSGEAGEFSLAELPKAENLRLFWWIAGGETPQEIGLAEIDVNLKATELLAQLHDELRTSGYPDHEMREWLTRILFCLFADDTDIWEPKLFENLVESRTHEDGSDLGWRIHEFFKILNTPVDDRTERVVFDPDLSAFAYVNGDLFESDLPIPTCTEAARDALLQACRFNWKKVSPAIFGSLFQNVMEPAERRKLGAHYTTEENILRTIGPLFLDGLRDELAGATTRPALDRLHDKIAGLTFLDPACGCGNFLVIAYRELRRLELEILRKRGEVGRAGQRHQAGQLTTDLELLCRVTVDQFYGIEIEEFPALIARTALYLMDHLANLEVSAEFGETYARFPIESSPHIQVANALRIDWGDLLPAEEADFVFGNPPFSGLSMAGQDATMKEDKEIAFAGLRHSDTRTGRLDYVAAWYAKAIPYMLAGHSATAFVSTNSLVQGEQARSMGPILQANDIEIIFAHKPFKWTSEAKGPAQVHVVIIGMAPSQFVNARPRLFMHGDPSSQVERERERDPKRVNWYLVDGPPVYPAKHRQPLLAAIPGRPVQGSKPVDNGNLIVEADAYAAVAADPIAVKYLRPFRQAQQLLYSQERWCLWLEGAPPGDIVDSPVLQERLRAVAAFRRRSRTKAFRDAATTPGLFVQRRQPTVRYLAIPETSSENRHCVPMTYFEPEVIGGNALLLLPDPPPWLFGILQSSMWMAWVRAVAGRLGTGLRISPDLTYSAFPWPDLTEQREERIAAAAQGVLAAREQYPNSSLADLYDPLAMPVELTEAHRKLDKVVDAAYGRHRHSGDETRLPVLLRRYTELTGGDLTLFDNDPEAID